MEEIKVYVIDKGRKNLYLCYLDPTTGKQVTKSAKTAKPKRALEEGGKWQAELREGRYQKPSRINWVVPRAVPGQRAAGTRATYGRNLRIIAKCIRGQEQPAEVVGRHYVTYHRVCHHAPN